ncbi:hypothetical protein BGZ83_009491, partial [Gryganskiella cystojenkinii]
YAEVRGSFALVHQLQWESIAWICYRYHYFGRNSQVVADMHWIHKSAIVEFTQTKAYNSADGAQRSYAIKVLSGPHENRVEEANKFYTEVLDMFITLHGQHLA